MSRVANRMVAAVFCLGLLVAVGQAQSQSPVAPPARSVDVVAKEKPAADAAQVARELAAARKELRDAKAAEGKAQGEKEQQAARARVQQATLKLAKASAATAATRVIQVRSAAGGAANRTSGVNTVRTDDQVQDSRERFLVILPNGPLIFEVEVTVDDKPFRTRREKLIDEMFEAADSDGDGQVQWAAALKNPRFSMGRFSSNQPGSLERYIKIWDADGDQLVDRVEARAYLARSYGGEAFVVQTTNAKAAGYTQASRGMVATGNADVRQLLDADQDGVLSADEIQGASERLKSRDADDNDLLYAGEIGNPQPAARTPQRGRPQAQRPKYVLLGPTAKAADLYTTLLFHYQNEDQKITPSAFAAVPGLFEQLDANRDGQLQQAETLQLNGVEPHVQLHVSLGKTKSAPLRIESLADGWKSSADAGDSLSVEAPGLKIALSSNSASAPMPDYQRLASQNLTRFDKDGNQYLDKTELTGTYERMMAMWDLDGDGKVFAKEIAQTYARAQAPYQSQVRAAVADRGNSLFQALDLSGDNRLSLREIRTAAERIVAFDENQDGQIQRDEIPSSVSVVFMLGTSRYSYVVQRSSGGTAAAQPQKNGAPDWFNRMDRNGDGDVTLKEFLGDKSQFKQLDTNSDGFIEPNEAAAASASGG